LILRNIRFFMMSTSQANVHSDWLVSILLCGYVLQVCQISKWLNQFHHEYSTITVGKRSWKQLSKL
jgi:hypothetical protein